MLLSWPHKAIPVPARSRAPSEQRRPRLVRVAGCRRCFVAMLVVGIATACTAAESPAILLFDGVGISPGDVAAVRGVLYRSHLPFATADSRRLNAMSEVELRSYRLLIVPGGNFILVGVHPEAPDGWRRGMTFATSADADNADNAYAATLIKAALEGARLPHF